MDAKRIVTCCIAAVSTACATAGNAGSHFVAPARIESGSQYPNFEMPTSSSDIRTGRSDFQIWIDADGNPEPDTFKASGAASESEAQSVKRWMLASRFHPATQDGKPVRGLYKLSNKVRLERH